MKSLLSFLFLVSLASAASSQTGEPIKLWSENPPGALGNADQDIPTLTPFLPAADKATGAAIVVCPGGGYGGLAPHEGRDYALFLNQHGVLALVLKYRLGSAGYRHPIILGDAARAVRFVRSKAAEMRIDPKRIGIMGSSAGGHLVSTLVTHFDAGRPEADDPIERQSSRPDLAILCYPVITMVGEFTHKGSKQNLLGKEPSDELSRDVSNDLQVKKDSPPCFIWHTWEDSGVKVENALLFASALRKAGVPFDLHVFQKGRHGIGLNDTEPFANAHPWSRDLIFWLKEYGWVK
jgi:acetyl esterase/lipase